MKDPLNIFINGWYGQLNAGDDAILDVFIEQIQARFDAHVTVLSELPENIPNTSRVRSLFHPALLGRETPSALLKGRFWRHLNELRTADLFVLGGGGILRDNTNWRNLVRLLDEIWYAKLLGKRVMLYGIGVGPFKTALGRRLIGASVRMCDLVTVRSQRAAELLREVGVEAGRIHVVADPAFLLAPRMPADPALRALFEPGTRTIGFYPTFALETQHKGEQFDDLARALDALAEDPEVRLVAVPMSVRENGADDVATARDIQARMKHPERLRIYEKRLSAAELKWVSSQAALNLTVRLHAMIFSLGCNVPVVAINYEPKVSNVFSDFDEPQYLIEMEAGMDVRITAAVRQALGELPAYGARIRQRRAAIHAGAMRTFDLLAGLYPHRQPVADEEAMPATSGAGDANAG